MRPRIADDPASLLGSRFKPPSRLCNDLVGVIYNPQPVSDALCGRRGQTPPGPSPSTCESGGVLVTDHHDAVDAAGPDRWIRRAEDPDDVFFDRLRARADLDPTPEAAARSSRLTPPGPPAEFAIDRPDGSVAHPSDVLEQCRVELLPLVRGCPAKLVDHGAQELFEPQLLGRAVLVRLRDGPSTNLFAWVGVRLLVRLQKQVERGFIGDDLVQAPDLEPDSSLSYIKS